MIRALIVGLANAYTTIIFVYVIMSWIPAQTGIIADIYRVLGKICLEIVSTVGLIPVGGCIT